MLSSGVATVDPKCQRAGLVVVFDINPATSFEWYTNRESAKCRIAWTRSGELVDITVHHLGHAGHLIDVEVDQELSMMMMFSYQRLLKYVPVPSFTVTVSVDIPWSLVHWR